RTAWLLSTFVFFFCTLVANRHHLLFAFALVDVCFTATRSAYMGIELTYAELTYPAAFAIGMWQPVTAIACMAF
ncbi:hypothetical protein JVW08_19900, partial [Vibrio cholerae O1]|uniref:hypothetical protein n=1 Tax=Vibrio cholerae TaxID=666 RepID=UPI001C115113